MNWSTPCSPEIEAMCQAYAREASVGRYFYAHCETRFGVTYCAPGDDCSGGTCRCTATRECAPAREVCVSDTPEGEHYCLPFCTPR